MTAKNDMGTRLKAARTASGLTLEQVAAQLGVTAQSVHNWEAGKNWPTKDRLNQLALIVNADLGYLLTGIGDGSHTVRPSVASISGSRVIPKVTFMQAVQQVPWEDLTADRISTFFPCGQNAFAFIVEDRSNAPAFEPGDGVVIDPDIKPEPGDMVLVRLSDGAGLFRRYRPRHDGKIDLLAHNPDWLPVSVESEKVTIIGTMSEHARPRR